MNTKPSSNELSGSCLCGSVKVTVNPKSRKFAACHCGMCRKRAGGPFLSMDCDSEVKFTGEEYVSRYQSSDWAERGFCKKCGSNLFYLLKPTQTYFMSISLFEGDFEFDHQVFIDEKPAYYDFANKTHTLTGAEVFAMFSEFGKSSK